jgi:hypothetical protein
MLLSTATAVVESVQHIKSVGQKFSTLLKSNYEAVVCFLKLSKKLFLFISSLTLKSKSFPNRDLRRKSLRTNINKHEGANLIN